MMSNVTYVRRNPPHLSGEDGVEDRTMHDDAGAGEVEAGGNDVDVPCSRSAKEDRVVFQLSSQIGAEARDLLIHRIVVRENGAKLSFVGLEILQHFLAYRVQVLFRELMPARSQPRACPRRFR